MLFRFCLYGFLKNQQYYDPFLVLAFREKGLSFFVIGVLLAFRHICTNVLQVPTGVIADTWGRRRSMILAFSAYIVSFVLYGFSTDLPVLFIATFCFAIGESFRSGTHKAMIFSWLQRMGREREKTRYYGLTRSWSQLGSALSVVIAAIIVFTFNRYSLIFWISIIPYIAGIINILGYPAFLDGERKQAFTVKGAALELIRAFKDSWRNIALRDLFTESMVFKGSYTVAKQYLQPLLKTAALSFPLLLAFSGEQRAAVLVGAVYVVLYLLSSLASRHAHTLCAWFGGEKKASQMLWVIQCACFLLMIPALGWNKLWWAVLCFLLLAILQNTFRPVYMCRLDEVSDADLGATILSIDSQLESMFVMIGAPLLGLAVDQFGLWPIGVFGVLGAVMVLGYLNRGKEKKLHIEISP